MGLQKFVNLEFDLQIFVNLSFDLQKFALFILEIFIFEKLLEPQLRSTRPKISILLNLQYFFFNYYTQDNPQVKRNDKFTRSSP